VTTEGPALAALTRRLAECPPDFLAEPHIAQLGVVHVDAVVADLLRALGGPALDAAASAPFRSNDVQRDRNRLALVLLACWLLTDSAFRQGDRGRQALTFLTGPALGDLAPLVPAHRCVEEDDRREELVRLCLQALDMRPAGETEAQAQDRLMTVSSAERRRVVAAARAAEARAAAIREAMRRQAAAAGPARHSRE
jgi:hypothetical protein